MLSILNYILTIGIAAVAASGVINGAGDDGHGVFGYTGLALPLSALCVVVWRALRRPLRNVGTYLFLWPVAMVLLSRTLFPNGEGLQSVYPLLLAASVALSALVRPDFTWGAVFLFSALFYTGQVVMETREPSPSGGPLSFFFQLLGFWALSFAAGFVPWWVLKRRGEAQEREFDAMLEEVRNNALSGAMGRSRDLGAARRDFAGKNPVAENATVPMGVGTRTLRIDGAASSTDTISLLNVGGDGVNVQLKSMLYFMRYNFKGLTASAFIYDGAKNTLALNCYDAKTGVQIVENAQIPFGAGVIGKAAKDNMLFMSGDLSLYQGSGLPYYAKDEGVCSILAAPIVAESSKELIGVLAVDSVNKNAFTEHDKELMRRFAIIAAALIVNIRMRVSLEHAAKTFNALYELSHNLSVALKPEEIFRVILDMVPKAAPACSRQIIALHDRERNSIKLQHIGGAAGELAEGMEFATATGGIYAYAFNKGCTVNVGDVQAKRNYRFVPEEPQNPNVRSLLIIPIFGGEERRCVGLFSAESATPEFFNPELEQILNTMVENASVALTRSMLYLKMEKLATTDGLTGLNNHRTFQEIAAREFERAKRHGRPLSMLLTDIDHFKNFNDTYGHPVGDLVLREIAGCIRIAVRATDFPARYGGEEFTVVLPETAEQGAMAIAERIRQTVEAKVIENGQNKLRVTISIGCATFPTYGTTQQELIDCADKALYASKKGGRNMVSLYNPGMKVSSK
ncbi:MAG: diguanylate cyclase [Chitinispirillales bacterium]|jgi:diguanylate cyclase (GGDEF)-like protein|nr:diguanylate cyclase [Chitinispirillales bacterium]